MINTDKYKGHTPAPWTLEKVEETYAQHEHYLLIGNDNLLSAIHHGGQEWDEHESNAQLIADAPLLLEEVKRLQPMADELIAIWEILEEDYPQVDRAIVKELIERKIGDYEVIE